MFTILWRGLGAGFQEQISPKHAGQLFEQLRPLRPITPDSLRKAIESHDPLAPEALAHLKRCRTPSANAATIDLTWMKTRLISCSSRYCPVLPSTS